MSELLQSRVALALDAVHLPTAKANLVTHLRNVADRELTPLEFLDGLLADELAARQERSIAVRTKLAHFPVLKTLDSFDFDAQATLDRRVLNELQTLAFVERAENVALLGPAGVGKTHLAIGLGMKALQAGLRVYFLTAQDLLDQIHAAQLDGIPGHKQRHLNTVPLLIIDELDTFSSNEPLQRGSSNSCVNATNIEQRSSRVTNPSRPGATYLGIRRLPPPSSTASCTTPTSSISKARATECEHAAKDEIKAKAKNPRRVGPP